MGHKEYGLIGIESVGKGKRENPFKKDWSKVEGWRKRRNKKFEPTRFAGRSRKRMGGSILQSPN